MLKTNVIPFIPEFNEDNALHNKRLEMIVFGEDWGAHPSSTQHLIKHIMRDHDVIWMNSLGLRRPRFGAHDLKRAVRKLARMFNRPARLEPERTAPPILNPRAISWPGSKIAGAFNRYSLARQMDAAMAVHGFERPILWTSLPSAIDVIDHYPELRVVYYCGDDFSALAGVDHTAVAEMEARLAARADLIITASDVLSSHFAAQKNIVIEHGVDYELFASDAPRAPDLPNRSNIAGFYGSIHEWIDLDMIEQAAYACPQWDFVFIGKVHVDVSRLQSMSNIHFLGPRDHADLPQYVQHWDVSILPFKDCPQIEACNPLKLREYLSAGRLVCSTGFPALAPYKDRVLSVQTGQDLAHTLRGLTDHKADRWSDRSMRALDWRAKARDVVDALKSL